MNRYSSWRALAGTMLVIAVGATARGQNQPSTDLYGDPLPKGARVRYGRLRLRHAGPVQSVAFSPDGNKIASGSDDKTMRLWDVESGTELGKLEGHTFGVTSVAFSPDGKRVASGSDDQTIRLWDVKGGKELRKLEGHGDGVWFVAYSPDGNWLASGSWDTTALLWDVSLPD